MTQLAFDACAQRYRPDVWRLCRSLCGQRADAEDLFQETWLRAYCKKDSFHAGEDFRRWVFAICCNLHKNLLRTKSRRPAEKDCSTAESYDVQMENLETPDSTEQTLQHLAVEQALAALDPQQRIVVVLYYLQDHAVSEVAAILHLPEHTVKNRLFAARKQLKGRLTEDA